MHLIFAAVLLASTAWAQTVLHAGNAASGSPNVAPGSVIAVQLFPGTGTANPQSLVILSVPYFMAALPSVAGPTGATWAVIPESVPLGPATVTLLTNGVTSPPATINIVPSAPGVFTMAGNGIGPAIAQNDEIGVLPVLNQLTHPALPGDYITLWATGLGTVATPDVTVEVAGTSVQASYAGPSPQFAGIDQINFPLPASLADGCYLPVVVHAGSALSNEGTIAKSVGSGSCPHPLGLTADQEKALDQGGSVLAGLVSLNSSVIPAVPNTSGYTRGEGVTATFLDRSAFAVFELAQPQQPDSRYFSCSLANGLTLGFVEVTNGDAGPSLTLTGPGNQILDIPKNVGALYTKILPAVPTVSDPAQLPPPFFTPGSWEISGPGGTTIGSFQQIFSLPPGVAWTNRAALTTLGRTADVTVTWNPQGYSANDVMAVTLTGPVQVPLPAGTTATGMICRAPAQAGQLVLPHTLLQQVAPAANAALTLQVSPRPSSRPSFALPLAGGGSSTGWLDYQFIHTLLVNLQ